MLYKNVPGVNKKLSSIIFGTSSLGTESGYKYRFLKSERRKIFKLFDYAYNYGYTAFDTASIYMLGESEKILGEWIQANGLRKEIVIITKGGHPNYFFLPSIIYGEARIKRSELKKDIETSLKRLKTDYIDIYMLHRDNESADIEEILLTLNSYMSSNNISIIGASNWQKNRVEQANSFAKNYNLKKFSVTSPHYSLFNWSYTPWKGTVSIAGREGIPSLDWYASQKIPIFAWSPLAGGNFSFLHSKKEDLQGSKKSPYSTFRNLTMLRKIEELAAIEKIKKEKLILSWMIHRRDVEIFPIVKSMKLENIKENSLSSEYFLSKIIMEEMNKISLI